MVDNLRIESQTRVATSGDVKMLVKIFKNEKLEDECLMTIDDFTTLLKKSERARKDTHSIMEIGEMPEGIHYFDGYLSDEVGTLGGIFYREPSKHQFLLKNGNSTECYYLALPGLVYAISFNKGSKKSMSCFAYRKWEGADTILFQYPFGNVSNSGDVCMGTISRKVSRFADIGDYIEASLDGVTNGDYLSNNLVRLSCDKTQYAFCEEIKDFDEFPLELLMEQPNLKDCKELRDKFFTANRVR